MSFVLQWPDGTRLVLEWWLPRPVVSIGGPDRAGIKNGYAYAMHTEPVHALSGEVGSATRIRAWKGGRAHW